MNLIINDDNLQQNKIKESSTKVRAILIDENNQILIANYGNVILLPGGKVDHNETYLTAIQRELKEELGQDYNNEELEYFLTLNYYQKDYPKRDGTFQNRLIQTHYYIGSYKEVNKDKQNLTEKEKNSNFRLELVPLEQLENLILNNNNSNPRNIYFRKELLTVLAFYKKIYATSKTKKLELQ